jgi:putative transposase
MANSARPKQLDLPAPASWGGRRAGAGRKGSDPRPGPAHAMRPRHEARHPVHTTLRARRGLASFRSPVAFAALKRALARASRDWFRVTSFSVQRDHVHLIVEADTRSALIRGVQGLAVRCARAFNRATHHRGSVWSHRYHARALATPNEVRLGLVYVLLNHRKHLRAPPGVDPCSSGPWFHGWAASPKRHPAPSPVASARTWLGAFGWHRAGGAIDCHESPGSREPSARKRFKKNMNVGGRAAHASP